MRRSGLVAVLAVLVVLPLLGSVAAQDGPPECRPGGDTVVLDGAVTPDDAKTYLILPFDVVEGTTRIEVGYAWADEGVGGSPPPPSTPLTQTVFDLGLWDTDGYRTVEGFRGWSGSRQGRLHADDDPVWVQTDDADRAYAPGPIEAGVWYVELGVAAVGPGGATWRVEVTCLDPPVGDPPGDDPVDPTHVANPEPGWYHGDFHLHAVHSHPQAPTWDEYMDFAREAGLDFLPITEYVVPWHWTELGQVQRDHPDLLIWPGREIITYFGHAVTLGETPSTIEYRHGFEDISISTIQRNAVTDGALYQVAHPTTFPEPAFANFCRGCEYNLEGDTDWAIVDTIEVLTGPIIVDPSDIGGPPTPRGVQNPFTQDAIDLWEEMLAAGYKITAVSGSDDKLGPGWGMNATAVYAEELSRPGLVEAVRRGRAYVRTRGVADSPELEFTGSTADGQEAMFGDTLHADEAELTVTVRGGGGQLLRVIRDGDWVDVRPIDDDDFTYTFTATRDDGSGPFGTFWRVETLDDRSLTTIGNPIFLAAGEPDATVPPAPQPDPGARGPQAAPPATLPATGAGVGLAVLALYSAALSWRWTAARSS